MTRQPCLAILSFAACVCEAIFDDLQPCGEVECEHGDEGEWEGDGEPESEAGGADGGAGGEDAGGEEGLLVWLVSEGG